MTAKKASSIAAAVAAVLFTGCGRESDQPWRKALDEGRVYKLGGGIGPVSPSPSPNPAPAVVVTPPVIIQAPVSTAPTTAPAKTGDDLPVPAPPKAADKKAAAPTPKQDGEPALGPPY